MKRARRSILAMRRRRSSTTSWRSKKPPPHLIEGFSGRTRAFVQVQNGCDHRCTFCIIPYGRGNSRSVPMGAVVADVRRLVGNGYCEVVLTGVDITSYGADLPGAPKLGTLVKQILKHVPELKRLRLVVNRLGRGRPRFDRCVRAGRAADAAPASVAAGRRRFDPQAHEAPPFAQGRDRASATPCAGCGRTLCSAPISSPAFRPRPKTMFKNSLDLVDDCGLTHLHVFPFSARAGTPAARMPQLSRTVVKERARRLRERGAIALRGISIARSAPRGGCWRNRGRAGPDRAIHAGLAWDAGRARRDRRTKNYRPRRQTIAGVVSVRVIRRPAVSASPVHPHSANAARMCGGTGALTRIGARFL